MVKLLKRLKKSDFVSFLISSERQSQENIKKGESYFYLDLMKCIAIIFVIAYHTGAVNNNIIETPGINTYINYFMTTLLATCVPLFFFVNGFLLLNKPLNIGRHAKKLFNILLLYFFWGIITYPLVYSLNNIPFTVESMISDFMQSKTGYTNHLWFLSALLGIYVLYPLIKNAYVSNYKIFIFFLTAVFIMAFGTRFLSQFFDIVIYNSRGELDWGITSFFSSFNKFSSTYGFALIYFMIGGVMYRHKNVVVSKKIIPIVVVVTSMLLSFGYGTMMSRASNELYDVVWSGYDTIPTLVIVISLFYLFKSFHYNDSVFNKIILVVGRNSLGIYLLHNIIILTTKAHFMELWETNNFIIRYTYVFIVLILSLCITLLIKRIPFVSRILKI